MLFEKAMHLTKLRHRKEGQPFGANPLSRSSEEEMWHVIFVRTMLWREIKGRYYFGAGKKP